MFKHKSRRYPGTKPFTREEASLFFGREDDIKNLNEMISLDSIVVVYGKSGYGKSSLVNAGLLPLLEKKSSNICLMPRLNAWKDKSSPSPLQKTRETIKELSKNYEVLDKVLEDDDTLWRKIKAFQFANPDKRLNIFFDQFEELFTYPKNQVDQFKREIAEVIRKQIPRRYEKSLDSQGSEENEILTLEEEDKLYKNLNIRVVFIIRSDKMHLLDHLSDYLPRILRNNYEIKALAEKSAITALVQPALLEEKDFFTPPFTYNKDALSKIIAFLKDESSGLVEAIQLQILATSFEDKVANENLKELTDSNIGNLQSIVKNYYHNKLHSITDVDERKLASKMIEDGLVDKERHQRLTLHESQIKALFEVESPLLNLLVEAHLLRRQPDSRSGYNYELSHDTLIAPVLSARSIRELKEKEEDFKNQRKELVRERRKRRRAYLLALFAFGAFILAGISALWAYSNYKALNTTKEALAKKEVETSKLSIEAQNEKNRAEKAFEAARRDSLLADSILNVANIANLNASEALIQANYAKRAQLIADKERALTYAQFRQEVEKGKELQKNISSGNVEQGYDIDYLAEEGDRQFGLDNFKSALTYYSNAKFLYKGEKLELYTIDEIENKISSSKNISLAEEKFKEGNFSGLISVYDDLQEEEINKAPFLYKRVTQIESSQLAFDKGIENGINKYGSINNIESLYFSPSDDEDNFSVWESSKNNELHILDKITIENCKDEIFLNGLPIEVDSIIIINCGIEDVPGIHWANETTYLQIENCKDLTQLSLEMLKYDMLEHLVLKNNPNIEIVPFNWEYIDFLEKIELSGNHNLLFILTGYMTALDGDPGFEIPIESLILKDIVFNQNTDMMGMASVAAEDMDWDYFGLGIEVISKYKALEELEIDNIFLDDLEMQEFDFRENPELSVLKIKNLKNTFKFPSLKDLENLVELEISNLPIRNNVFSEIGNLITLQKLTLADLPNQSEWSDLSALTNLEYLVLKNVPAVRDVNKLLAHMPNLKYLELDNVDLGGEFPSNINNKVHLETLKIRNTKLSNFTLDPSVLNQLTELEFSNISGMKDEDYGLISKFDKVATLTISSDYLEFVRMMTGIKKLEIKYNANSDELPDVFSNLQNLKILKIHDTNIKKLPQSVFTLPMLNTVWLERTNIERISPQFVHNRNLKNLIIQNNSKITSLPDNIDDFPSLKNILFYNSGRRTFNNEEILKISSKGIDFRFTNNREQILSIIQD